MKISTIFQKPQGLIVVILVAIVMFISVQFASAVSTNGANTPWTREKAEHLAKKTLFGPTPGLVDQLFVAGSAANAVDILFPASAPSMTQFDSELAALVASPGFDMTAKSSMNQYYQLKLLRNPYEAKQKLAMLFYDIRAVNRTQDISYADVIEQHQIIDDKLFGSYKEFTQRLVFNNDNGGGNGVGGRGDYAQGKFVDLFRLNINFPNENYARELVQLFLMGEYKPFESAEDGDTPNYTDDDVAALARKMTGLEDDPVTHQVTYNPLAHNYATGVHLFSGAVAPGYNLHFYDPVTDTVDFGAATQSTNGNNGLFDNTIEYIFAKRQDEIALFLAHKLFTYYVHEDPTPVQIDTFATEILANNFEILPSVKYLLAQDRMFSNESMNTPYYKTPVDLTIGTLKVLGQNNNYINEIVYDQHLLEKLDWAPYYPGSVFGRDAFDRNADWINQYSYNQWLTMASDIVFSNDSGTWSNGVIMTGNEGITSGYTGTTATGFVDFLEDTIYIGQSLDPTIKASIIDYATSGNSITFDLTDSNYVNTRARGVIVQMLAQPEFIMLDGFDLAPSATTPSTSSIAGNHNIVFLELFGGNDWIYSVLPKDQYTDYVELRSVLSVPFVNMMPAGEHFFNQDVSAFKTLYDNGNLILFHGVGMPNHSRGHDTAQRQSVSAGNEQKFGGLGAFGQLIDTDDPDNTIVVGSVKPNVLSQGNYINIGRNSSEIRFGASWSALPNTRERDAVITTMKNILAARTYPDTTQDVFQGALELDTIATLPGQQSPGYQLSGQLAYIQKLIDNNYGHAYYAVGGGGFDTHANQKDANYLGDKMNNITNAVAGFFNNFNTPGETLTIVMHSEFGRTIQRNGSDGTDHGKGGGFFVLSNNPAVLSTFGAKTYGDIALKLNKRDWLGVGIDARAIFGRLFDAMYNGNPGYTNSYPTYDLHNEIDTKAPEFAYLRPEFVPNGGNSVATTMKFSVDDVNFKPHSMASHIIPALGSSPSTLTEFSRWKITNEVLGINDGIYTVRDGSENPDNILHYSLELRDNQHIVTQLQGQTLTPTIYGPTQNTLPNNKHAIFRDYTNTSVTTAGPVSLGTGVNIPVGTYQAANTTDISMQANIPTQLTSLAGSGTWNGAFLLPWSLDVEAFLAQESREVPSNILLDTMNIEKLFVAGPDTLGIGGSLNQPVEFTVQGLLSNSNYKVLHSIDGKDWDVVSNTTSTAGGAVTFSTSQLSYFALASDEVSCTLTAEKLPGVYEYNLYWEAPNATALSLDNGIGTITAAFSGLYAVTMPEDIVRTYTMTAGNAGGNTTCSTTISTELNIVLTPPSCIMSATNNNDGTATLAWTGTDVVVANINNNIGDVNGATGSVVVQLPPNQTYNFTMTALGVNANSSCNASVFVTAQNANPNQYINNGGGGGGGAQPHNPKDVCPDLDGDGIGDDYTISNYDGDCGNPTNSSTNNNTNTNTNTSNNTNTTISTTPGDGKSVHNDTVTDQEIVTWLHANGLTIFSDIEDFGPNSPMIRRHAARFYSQFAISVLGKQDPGDATDCPFVDLYKEPVGLAPWVCKSYKLGIFSGTPDGTFVGAMRMRQSHVWTTAMKALFNDIPSSSPWYKSFFVKAVGLNVLPEEFGYQTASDVATRIQVGRMLYNIAHQN